MSFLFQACRHAEAAIAIAKSANAEGYHFGAIVFNGKSVVSAGWCQCKTHPKQARFMKYAAPYKKNNSFLHAEMHAIVSAKTNIDGCDIIVARWANNKLKSSHPCNPCWQAIKYAGIRRVWYWKDGELIWRDVN